MAILVDTNVFPWGNNNNPLTSYFVEKEPVNSVRKLFWGGEVLDSDEARVRNELVQRDDLLGRIERRQITRIIT